MIKGAGEISTSGPLQPPVMIMGQEK